MRSSHTEPWDKFISLATGRIFGAWVDMREGDTFGATFTLEVDTSVAVFVPRVSPPVPPTSSLLIALAGSGQAATTLAFTRNVVASNSHRH